MASDIKIILSTSIYLYSTLLPQMSGRQTKLRLAPHSGNLTPPRISPSCPKRKDREYHCRRMRSWRNSLPVLLFDRWIRCAPYLAVFYTDALTVCTGGLGASSASLSLSKAHSLMLFCRRILCFQGACANFSWPARVRSEL